MSQKNYQPQNIELRVTDFVRGGTVAHQLVWNHTLTAVQGHDGYMVVTLGCWIIPYAVLPAGEGVLADGWGDELTGGPFHRRPHTLTADNNTLVEVTADPADPHFGRLLAIKGRKLRANAMTPEQEWADIEATFPGEWMAQGDFMVYVRDEVPQVLGQVQRGHLHMADLGGAFS